MGLTWSYRNFCAWLICSCDSNSQDYKCYHSNCCYSWVKDSAFIFVKTKVVIFETIKHDEGNLRTVVTSLMVISHIYVIWGSLIFWIHMRLVTNFQLPWDVTVQMQKRNFTLNFHFTCRSHSGNLDWFKTCLRETVKMEIVKNSSKISTFLTSI